MTVNEYNHVSISATLVKQFFAEFNTGQYEGQRLGQAFYNHFKLHRCASSVNPKLYEADGALARKLIEAITDWEN